MTEIKPIAVPGTHQSFLKYFNNFSFDKKLKILDIGAGHGAFTKRLYDMGFDVSACDLFPENFMFDKIECKKADITQQLPFSDNSFDLAIAIEVSDNSKIKNVSKLHNSTKLLLGRLLFLNFENNKTKSNA